MRPDRLRLRAIAAWLGVIALSLNALSPIRCAFALATDIAQARECGHGHTAAALPGAEWRLLALLIGQAADTDPSRTHKGIHGAAGAACGVAAGPAGFAVPTAAALLLPPRLAAIRPAFPAAAREPQATAAAYHSRAPPPQTA